jgi:hypothetical protein
MNFRRKMGVHSTVRPDSSLLKEAEGYQNIVIVGCTNCANASIAYEKNQPVHQVSVDKATGRTRMIPYSIKKEAARIQELLGDKGKGAGIELSSALCWHTADRYLSQIMGNPSWADQEFRRRCSGADAILALCCSTGIIGIKQRLEEEVKIIPGMIFVGMSQMSLRLDEEKEHVWIDPDKSRIIPSTRR